MTGMQLEHARYGKASVRLLNVRREGATHHVRELTVRALRRAAARAQGREG